MKPTVGRIVNYKLSEYDHDNLKNNFYKDSEGKLEGTLPAVIVRVWSETTVNLKVITDGPIDVWKTSVSQGDQPGNWNWPVRE